jgi:hypothetical protein
MTALAMGTANHIILHITQKGKILKYLYRIHVRRLVVRGGLQFRGPIGTVELFKNAVWVRRKIKYLIMRGRGIRVRRQVSHQRRRVDRLAAFSGGLRPPAARFLERRRRHLFHRQPMLFPGRSRAWRVARRGALPRRLRWPSFGSVGFGVG